MHPKLALAILLVLEVFLLTLLFSPGLWHSKSEGVAVSQLHKNRSPETERAYQAEHAGTKYRHYAVCSLAVLNVMVIIVYGALQQQKRPA